MEGKKREKKGRRESRRRRKGGRQSEDGEIRLEPIADVPVKGSRTPDQGRGSGASGKRKIKKFGDFIARTWQLIGPIPAQCPAPGFELGGF